MPLFWFKMNVWNFGHSLLWRLSCLNSCNLSENSSHSSCPGVFVMLEYVLQSDVLLAYVQWECFFSEILSWKTAALCRKSHFLEFLLHLLFIHMFPDKQNLPGRNIFCSGIPSRCHKNGITCEYCYPSVDFILYETQQLWAHMHITAWPFKKTL